LAMQHVRQFETARETALTLQRAMLPPIQPPPGFAVRYESAVPPLEIGGDWYDVLPVGEHRIGVVVGDCVGRGLPAAAIMGQLRSSARALLINGAQPAVLLEQLDSVAALIPNAYCTTVFLAIVDTESGIVEYSNAGHMPAMLAGPAPGTTLLTDASSVPLGVRRGDPRPQGFQVLPTGSTLMLFTDGLVERKRESIDDGIGRAADVLVQTMARSPDVIADAMLRELAPPGGYDDDVAMVIYQHQHAPLRLETPAIANQLAVARRRLTEWLRGAVTAEELRGDIVLVASEACTNCVQHAYRGRDVGTMRLEAEFVDHEIRLRISDCGSWRAPAANPGNSGRGLLLIRALSDSMEIDSTGSGTTVAVTFRIPSVV
ncbi:MAG: SpoIIE family protein phosphatase, partial [Mycobacterium sp.]|nr:SpoIIE family protein phosphatase [Mycobacterium sp.]